jgi:hypothetical protein
MNAIDCLIRPLISSQAAGYSTAMFGKWHLGHFRHAHLPRARGFDDFMGFYSGFQKYFTHVHAENMHRIAESNSNLIPISNHCLCCPRKANPLTVRMNASSTCVMAQQT